MILAAFSVLYTINIAVSNISLQLVTVPVSHDLPSLYSFVSESEINVPQTTLALRQDPHVRIVSRTNPRQFHQVVRASTPLFTILISSVILRTRFSAMKLVSLLPVVAGVGFA